MLDRVKFTAALKAAEAAALAIPIEGDGGDGGSCNFDTPYVTVPKGTRSSTIKECAEAAGVHVSPHYTSASRWMVHVTTTGQGYRRTKGAEAARDALKANGFESFVYYAVD